MGEQRLNEVGTRQSVLAFEEDWLSPGPEQCDIFTPPPTVWAECDVTHPNNTLAGTQTAEKLVMQDISKQIIWMMDIHFLGRCYSLVSSSIVYFKRGKSSFTFISFIVKMNFCCVAPYMDER